MNKLNSIFYYNLTPGTCSTQFSFQRPFEDINDILWCRKTYTPVKSKMGGRSIVHGYTYSDVRSLKQSIKAGGINIDCSCVFDSRGDGYSYLVGYELNSNTYHLYTLYRHYASIIGTGYNKSAIKACNVMRFKITPKYQFL